MNPRELVILGGGPAGVGAAYRAARRGIDVVLIEREAVVGGAAGSFEVAGVRVDHGSHRLHRTVGNEILQDLTRLLGQDLQQRERRGRIRLAGRWLAFPLRPGDLLRSLPPSMTARLARDAATSALRAPRADTFAEQVRARLGPTMLERFYGPYAEKLWGLPADQIDGEQFRRRVSAASTGALVTRVLRGRREAGHFLYPRGGFGRISEVLAEAAVSHGAELRLGRPVTALSPQPDGIRVTTAEDELVARTVLSTLPIAILPRLWERTPPEVVNHARSLDSRSMTLVYLVLDVPRYTRFDAHYFPERSSPVSRVSEPKNYRTDPDDPPDRTVLCAELPCDVGDEVWSADADHLGEVVAATLVDADLPPVTVSDATVRRLPAAYPIYRRGYREHLDPVERWIGDIDDLVTFGRQGLFVHDNSHHALAMAYAAVDALAPGGGVDRGAWQAARETFRSHVVED